MRQYEMVELTYQTAAPVGSEVFVDLQGTFICGEETVTVKGFYAGNNTYKVRFLPTQSGTYTYKITGVVEAEGKLDVAPAAEGKHGIPKADGTHMKYMDGSYYYAFGTTIYGLAHQTEELIQETMDSLATAPFNKVRMCVFPKNYMYNYNEPQYYAFSFAEGKSVTDIPNNKQPFGVIAPKGLWDVHRPDYRFWDAFEGRMKQLDDMGIVVDLIVFHPYDRWGFSQMSWEEDQVYLEYLTRRFSAIPNLMWSMANEYDLFMFKKMDDWYQIEDYIVKNDPYHHMISNHNCFATYDYSRENITHVSIQSRTVMRAPELLKEYGKPVLYDECCYEGNLEETFGSITGQEMSDRFWKVVTTGGYCTHGETYLDYDQEDIDNAVVHWAKGGKLVGSSPARIAYLREFVESLPGPIEPHYPVGFGTLVLMSKEELEQNLKEGPQWLLPLLLPIAAMSEKESIYHKIPEFTYCGCVGSDVYIYYYGMDVHGRVSIELPQDRTYRIDIIDTWNMTRETVMTGVSGAVAVRMPQKQWMAVVAVAE